MLMKKQGGDKKKERKKDSAFYLVIHIRCSGFDSCQKSFGREIAKPY
jgi:hypothetical protein